MMMANWYILNTIRVCCDQWNRSEVYRTIMEPSICYIVIIVTIITRIIKIIPGIRSPR